MGYGEYTGNQSVHWAVVQHGGSEPNAVWGRDPIKFEQIGVDASRDLAPGNFRVRLRYGSLAEAEQALAAARIVEDKGNYFVVLDVPAVNRPEDKVHPPDPPSEVRIDW